MASSYPTPDATALPQGEHRERELQRASDFHAVLLAMAGHDLRQPLQSITGAYDWLARRLTTSSEQEYIRRGHAAIMNLTRQLDLLIEALRLHQHSASIDLVPVGLAPVFARVCGECEDLASRKGLALHTCPNRAIVLSDAVLLEGILRNLVRNALRYTRPGGRILVGCRRRGTTSLQIEVHDTGIGIPPEKLSQIFEAFKRVDSTQVDGLGLGLFVVRRAVDLLGHALDVRSALGRGSCFSVTTNVAGVSSHLLASGRSSETRLPSDSNNFSTISRRRVAYKQLLCNISSQSRV
jgi:two-component system, OmpR family, phosphate regulon sensor histidine kinase PhoR